VRVNHRYVSVGDRRTHLVHGDYPIDTLFVHGVGGSAWTFEAVLSALLPTVGWASVDLLGYGDSSWVEGGDYPSALQAEQLLAVLDELGVEDLRVVGFSWGGLIALELAARDARVQKLAVIDVAPSSARASSDVPKTPATFASMPEATDAVLALAPRATLAVAGRDACLSTRPCPGGFEKKIDPALLARWQFREEDHWDTWRRIEQEVLLVRGELSPVLSRQDAERMAESGRNVTLVEVPACGHLIPLEQPQGLAAAIGPLVA